MNLRIVSDYKVLVVGDAIQDCYRFCLPLGRGTKESIISVKFNKEETFAGGVWAAAEHIRELCRIVDIWHGSRVMFNTKYVTGNYASKLFSVHEEKHRDASFPKLSLSEYDVIIVFDYGHGFLTNGIRERIMKEARWLAVNAQSNSLNYGFNRVNEKWPIANLCVCDELEARLAAHEPDASIEDVILKLPYPSIIVTQGANGATGYGNKEFYREGAATDRPIDLLGAGDAVLAVVAPFAKAGFSIKQLVHIGNIAGGIKVGILGHRGHVTKAELEKYL